MIERDDFLEWLVAHHDDELVVYTMSPYNFYRDRPQPLHFYVAGAMGYASSVGLGLALARPANQVWVLDGDGSLLMNLGTLVTIADVRPTNLVHFVLENGMYELVGQVPLPGVDGIELAAFARDAGIPNVHAYDTLATLDAELPEVLSQPGPTFVSVKVPLGPRKAVNGTSIFGRAASDASQFFAAELRALDGSAASATGSAGSFPTGHHSKL